MHINGKCFLMVRNNKIRLLDIPHVSTRVDLFEANISQNGTIIVAPERVHRDSGHRFAVWATAILKIADFPVQLIIPHTGQAARDVFRFADRSGFGKIVHLLPVEKIIPIGLKIADIALFLQPRCSSTKEISDTIANRPPSPVMLATLSEGIPLIVADTPISRYWFRSGRNALLVKHDNPRQIAQAMMKLIEDESFAKRVGLAGKELSACFAK